MFWHVTVLRQTTERRTDGRYGIARAKIKKAWKFVKVTTDVAVVQALVLTELMWCSWWSILRLWEKPSTDACWTSLSTLSLSWMSTAGKSASVSSPSVTLRPSSSDCRRTTLVQMSSTPLEVFRTEGTRQTSAPVSELYVLASSSKCAILYVGAYMNTCWWSHIFIYWLVTSLQ